jgi:RNA polymerase sigma factor (sigma-70 family)
VDPRESREILDAVYRDHRRGLVVHAIVLGAAPGEAEDFVHAAVASYLGRQRPEPVNDVCAWLRRAINSKIVSERRRASAQRKYEDRAQDLCGPAQDGADTNYWAEADRVAVLLSLCPPAQRQVLALIIDELSPAEIGHLLGKRPDTIRKNLQLARERLKEVIEKDPELAAEARRRRRRA